MVFAVTGSQQKKVHEAFRSSHCGDTASDMQSLCGSHCR